MRRTIRSLLVVLSVTGALCSVSEPMDAAVGGLRYVARTTSVASGTTKVDRAPCPRDTKVVGGGVNIEGGHGATTVNTTSPYDGPDKDKRPDDGWLGSVTNGAPSPPAKRLMTTFAVCAKTGKYKYVTSTQNILTAENVTKVAQCPDGMMVTGGGVFMSARSPFAYVSISAPFDRGDDADTIRSDGWTGAISLSGPEDGKLRVTAICTAIDPGIEYVEAPVTLTSLGFAVESKAECDPGAITTGGGVSHDGGYGVKLHSSGPFDSTDIEQKVDDRWTAKLSNPSGSATMTTIAICKL